MRSGEVTRQLAGANMGVQYLVWKTLALQASSMYTATLKKGFTGSGAAKKWDMIARANEVYGLNLVWPKLPKDQKNKKINDEDVADALAAAYCLEREIGDELRAGLKGETSNGN